MIASLAEIQADEIGTIRQYVSIMPNGIEVPYYPTVKVAANKWAVVGSGDWMTDEDVAEHACSGPVTGYVPDTPADPEVIAEVLEFPRPKLAVVPNE